MVTGNMFVGCAGERGGVGALLVLVRVKRYNATNM
jgi:hypothetical protein